MGLLFSALLVSSCGKEAATGKSMDASPKRETSVSERLFNAEMEIRRAVKANDTVGLRLVIFENPDLSLNTYLDDGDTLLVYAIKKKFHLIRNILLEKGAFADLISLQVDFSGQTPLMIAAHHGDSGSILALLDKNATIDLQDNIGDTALHKAIKNGYDEAAKTLIRAGSDLSIENDRRETPLETALSLGRKDISDFLQALSTLNDGAPSMAVFRQILKDGDIVNYRKLVATHKDVILEYASINPLVITMEAPNSHYTFEMVQSLLTIKVSPDGPEESEITPLGAAVRMKRRDLFELLLRFKVDVSKLDRSGNPALAYAIENNDDTFVELLMNNGAETKTGEFSACRLAYRTLRKLETQDEKDNMKRIISRFNCRWPR